MACAFDFSGNVFQNFNSIGYCAVFFFQQGPNLICKLIVLLLGVHPVHPLPVRVRLLDINAFDI